MVFLFLQTWLWILLAGLLGLLIGWLIWGHRSSAESADMALLKRQLEDCREQCRNLESDRDEALAGAALPASVALAAGPAAQEMSPGGDEDIEPVIQDDWKPVALDEPEGEADDLKRIKGIGPVIEKTLNELGIFHFRQVAAFTADNIKWVDNYIAFPGRIQREEWISQAASLDAGETTEFSNRYDKSDRRR